ncbi:MAG TPA: caspase family protein, partial [Polyangiaceae bacterium]|nr:caspase family protein [Polyangiaceae bacterium]
MRLLRAWRHLVLLALALGGTRPCWAQSGSTAEPRVALIIGNADYDDSPLKNPTNDARLMASTLEGLGFSVLLRLDASQREMKQAIEDFGSRLHRGGTAVFYFAGHGVQSGGRNYMIPVGAKIQGESFVDIESVDVQRVLATMEAANTDVNLVILDACRNNPFQQSTRSQNRGLAFISAPRGTLIAYATAPGSVAVDGTGNHGIYTA